MNACPLGVKKKERGPSNFERLTQEFFAVAKRFVNHRLLISTYRGIFKNLEPWNVRSVSFSKGRALLLARFLFFWFAHFDFDGRKIFLDTFKCNAPFFFLLWFQDEKL